MFCKNGYLFKFVDQVCEKFINQEPQEDNSVSTQYSAESERVPFCLLKVPYYGKSSHGFAKDMKKLIEDNFKVEVRVVFTTCKTGSFSA